MIENCILSGFKELDELTSGFKKSDLIIFSSRPAMGKTCFCLNLANNIASQSNNSVLLFSLDISYEKIINRLKLDDSLKVDNVVHITKRLNDSKEVSLIIDDTPSISLIDIEKKARDINSYNNIGLIIIDYLQLIKIDKSEDIDCRNNEISEILKRLKLLAEELKVPILCQSQLSRELENRENKRPILSDFGDITSIEELADTIIFLYRDGYYNLSNGEDKEKAEIIIAKHHNKFINGTIYLNYDSKLRKFQFTQNNIINV